MYVCMCSNRHSEGVKNLHSELERVKYVCMGSNLHSEGVKYICMHVTCSNLYSEGVKFALNRSVVNSLFLMFSFIGNTSGAAWRFQCALVSISQCIHLSQGLSSSQQRFLSVAV
jgi:hypothetical protein